MASSGSDYCVIGSDVHRDRLWTKGSAGQLDGNDLQFMVTSEERAYNTNSVRQAFESVVSPCYIFTIIESTILPKTE